MTNASKLRAILELRRVGLVVSVRTFYSDNPNSNPAHKYRFSQKKLERTKINNKLPLLAHIFNST